MFTDLITNITVGCSSCKTKIQLEVANNISEMHTLFSELSTFMCPRCKESLANDARSALQAVQKYNTSVLELVDLQRNT